MDRDHRSLEVEAVGFAIMKARYSGGYNVRCWTRIKGRGTAQVDYVRLVYTEVVDVILAHLDTNRPGTISGLDWTQETLDDAFG